MRACEAQACLSAACGLPFAEVQWNLPARTLQKRGGCLHMTCRQCRHHWCWECGRAWSEHNAETGGWLGGWLAGWLGAFLHAMPRCAVLC